MHKATGQRKTRGAAMPAKPVMNAGQAAPIHTRKVIGVLKLEGKARIAGLFNLKAMRRGSTEQGQSCARGRASPMCTTRATQILHSLPMLRAAFSRSLRRRQATGPAACAFPNA